MTGDDTAREMARALRQKIAAKLPPRDIAKAKRAKALSAKAPAGALGGGFGPDERADAEGYFDERRLAEAEKALGLATPDDELRRSLAYVLWKDLRNRRYEDARQVFRKRAERLGKAADDLSVELSDLIRSSGDDPLDDDLVCDLTDVARKLTFDARNGRPVDTSERRVALARLYQIVFEITGKYRKYTTDHHSDSNKFTGPLFLLARAFADAEASALDKEAPNDASIAKLIQRTDLKSAQATNLPLK